MFFKDIALDYPLRSEQFDDYSLLAVGKWDKTTSGTACHVENVFIHNASDENGKVSAQDKLLWIRDNCSEVTSFYLE